MLAVTDSNHGNFFAHVLLRPDSNRRRISHAPNTIHILVDSNLFCATCILEVEYNCVEHNCSTRNFF